MGAMVGWTSVPSRLVAAARALGWGHNALRRRSDRIGYAARLTAVAVAIGGLVFGVVTGELAFRRTLAVADAQTAVSRQVTATLTKDAPVFASLGTRPSTDQAPARWTFAGRPHHGPVTAAQGSRAGSTMRIWVNTAGDRIEPPLTRSDAELRGWLTGAAAFVATLVLVCTALRVVEWRLDHVRMRLWEQEWQRTDPKWTEKAG